MIVGHAFALDRGDGVALGSLTAGEAAVPVAKQWVASADGQAWLVESVAWKDLEPMVAQLPSVLRASTGSRAEGLSPDHRATASAQAGGVRDSLAAPMQLAGAPYQPAGLVFDYEIVPGANLTFESGKTYYNASGFYLGPATVTFQPGCVIKSANNVYLLCLGPVSFPDTLQTPVFTAVNDDSFGEDIDGTPGSVPTQCASKALWIYYVNASTEVRNARFRWAQTAVRYDQTGGVTASHTLHDSWFEHCQVGVYINLPDAWLYGWNLTKYQVTTPVQEPGYPSGRYNGLLNEALFAHDRNVIALSTTGEVLGPAGQMGPYPDCQMAAGPNHLVVLLNSVIAVFSKSSGALLEWADLPTLFGTADGQFGPRLLYDQNCQRWIACAAGGSLGPGNLYLAVSQSSDPTNIGQSWSRYVIPTAQSGYTADYPTLGVDANGLYIVVNYYVDPIPWPPSAWLHKVVAIKKTATCLNPILPQDQTILTLFSSDPNLILQPAVNFDTIGSDGIAWFLSKGPAPSGRIQCGRLQWVNGVPQFLENPWADSVSLSVSQPYYDLDSASSFSAPQSSCQGTTQSVFLTRVASRLMMATVRNGYLYMCHHIGVNQYGGYSGTPSDATRSAVQWFKIQTTPSLAISASGRVYDNAASNPYWYYFPSLAVSPAGDMVLGFTGSRTGEHIGAFFTARTATGSVLPNPVLLQAGRHYYDSGAWGDYTATCVDPDDVMFWTIQQYAETPLPGETPCGAHQYGTCLSALKRN